MICVETIGSGSVDFNLLPLGKDWVHYRFVIYFFGKLFDLFDTHKDVISDFFLSELLLSLFVVNFFKEAYLFFVSLGTIGMIMLNLADLVPVREDDLVLRVFQL